MGDGWDRARAWQNATLIDTRSLCQIHSFTRDCSSLLLDNPHGRSDRPTHPPVPPDNNNIVVGGGCGAVSSLMRK